MELKTTEVGVDIQAVGTTVKTSTNADESPLEPPSSILEKVMMVFGRTVSKHAHIVAPLVVSILIVFQCGWTRVTLTHLPFERLWSPDDGRLAAEWNYYEDYVVKPARVTEHYVGYVDKAVVDGGDVTGRGGNVLTANHFAEMLEVAKIFANTTVTTSMGNTYSGRDLCDRAGDDTPGPVPANGADTSVDGVGATNLTGTWQHATGAPGFLYSQATGVTDQHRANSYFAFKGLKCMQLLKGDTTAMAAWDDKVLYLPQATDPTSLGPFSFNELWGAEAPTATAHLLAFGLGGKALISHGTLCQALMVGYDLGGGSFIANALPGAKMPCQTMTPTDCFSERLSAQDPVYRNFLDPLLYSRSTGRDMSASLKPTLGAASPSGYTYKPSFTGKTSAQMAEAVSALKYGRYLNRTQILPTTMHSMAFLAQIDPRFAEPIVSETWSNCPAGKVAVYKDNATCSWQTDVDGCRVRDATTGELPDHDPMAGVLDPYVLSDEFLEKIRDYECVVPTMVNPAVVKPGCQFWATIGHWELFQVFGETPTYTDESKTMLATIPYVFEYYFMASPLTIKKRRSATFPDTEISDVEEALDLFTNEFDANLVAYRKRTTWVFLSPATSGYFERLNRESEHFPIDTFVIGAVLVYVLIVLAFIRCGHWMHQRVDLIGTCMFVVLLSLSSAMGLFSWVGLEFNTTMIAVIPFLGLAVGIDDVFILVRYFDHIGMKRVDKMQAEDTIAHVMKSGGSSVTLTSWCNAVAFALGYMVKVPGVSEFCLGASIVAMVDWLCMMTLIPILLKLEIIRIKARKFVLPSNFLLWLVSPTDDRPNALDDMEKSWDTIMNSVFSSCWVPFLSNPLVTLSVAAISIAFFVVSLYYSEIEPAMPLGFIPQDVAIDGSPTQHFLNQVTEHYGSFSVDIFFKDVDYPNQQKEIVELIDTLYQLDFIRLFPTPAWLTLFSSYIAAASGGELGLRNTDVYDATCTAPGMSTAVPECTSTTAPETTCCTVGCAAGAVPNFFSPTIPANIGNTNPDGSAKCDQIPNPFYCPNNISYTHPVFLPYGMVNAKCFYGILSLFQSEFLSSDPSILPFFPPEGKAGNVPNPLRAIGEQMQVDQLRKKDNTTQYYIVPTNQTKGYECSDPLRVAMPGCIASLRHPLNNGSVGNPLVLSRWELYMDEMQGAIGNDRQVANVVKVRELLEASPLAGKVFPQNVAFTYTEVNIELRPIFQKYFGIDIAVIGGIAIIFLQSIIAGVMTAAATTFIVYEIYASFSHILHFNMFTCTVLLMSVGITVEFTAHLIACYTMETKHLSGPKAKMSYALTVIGAPLVVGSISTFLGTLPLAWSDVTFIKLYFFRAFGVMVGIALANALCFLPGKLMLSTFVTDKLGCKF